MNIRMKTIGAIKIVRSGLDEEEIVGLLDEYIESIYNSGLAVGKFKQLENLNEEISDKIEKLRTML